MLTVRMRKKGQITLPREARDAMGLRESDRLLLTMEDDRIILRPLRQQPGYGKFLGIFKGTRRYPGSDEEEAAAETAMAEEANRVGSPGRD